MPPGFSLYQHLPPLTPPSRPFWRYRCLLGAIMAQIWRTRVPKVPPMSRKVVQEGLQAVIWTSTGTCQPHKTLQKHIRVSLFSRCHHDGLLDTSGHYCCNPNPQKGTLQHPRGPPRSPKPPILRQYVAHFSQLVSLRPQERSQDLPKCPPRCPNDPKRVLQTLKMS